MLKDSSGSGNVLVARTSEHIKSTFNIHKICTISWHWTYYELLNVTMFHAVNSHNILRYVNFSIVCLVSHTICDRPTSYKVSTEETFKFTLWVSKPPTQPPHLLRHHIIREESWNKHRARHYGILFNGILPKPLEGCGVLNKYSIQMLEVKL
jgi:hypothetical protein